MMYFGILFLGALLFWQKPNIEATVQEYSDSFLMYDSLFKSYAALYSVDWKMLKAISLNESMLGQVPSVARGIANPTDVEGSSSSDGKSWGIMQITLTTGRDFDSSVDAVKLNNVEYSIDLAARIISWLGRQFNLSDIQRNEWIVKSYNQGIGNTRKEMYGEIEGYATDYWDRYQRNLERVEARA